MFYIVMCLILLILGTLLEFPVIIASVKADRGDECGDLHGLKLKIHADSDGNNEFCCVDRKCHRGFSGLPCNDSNPAGSRCEECPPSKFNPSESYTSDGMQCEDKRLCSKTGETILSNGSHFEDRICICDRTKGYFYRKKKENPNFCRLRHCPPGKELDKNGTCKDCELDFFKKSNKSHVCIKKTDCTKLNLDFKYLNYTSRIEDNTCYNASVGKDVDITINEDATMVIVLSEFVTSPAGLQDVNKSPGIAVIAAVIVIPLTIIVLLICALVMFRKRKCKKPEDYHVVYRGENGYLKEVPSQCAGIEHDERLLLNLESRLPNQGRAPSETDDRDHCIPKIIEDLYKTPSGNPGGKSVQRQITVDSGFCNGNSSGSERGSADFEIESAEHTPSTSDLKAEPPVFPESASLPGSLKPTTPQNGIDCSKNGLSCVMSESVEKNSPGSVNNIIHVHGNNSFVQIASGRSGQNTISNTGPTCASCSVPETPEEEEDIIINRTGDNSAGSHENLEEVVMYTHSVPSENNQV